ncbi:MAG: HAD family hydrolase [Chloroflexota bacterium]
MCYAVLACDFDGTIATEGRVAEPTIAALERVRTSGRRLVLVTGRQIRDMQAIFPRLDLFDRVVGENGAVLYRPDTRELRPLAERPPEAFVSALVRQHVAPLDVGKVIVATTSPNEKIVLNTIHTQGLEMHIIFNRGSVMILPGGITKSSGLSVALADLALSAHNLVAVGDGENDHALLAGAECGVAVANAVQKLRERADFVTAAPNGAGVTDLCRRLMEDDLAELAPRLTRHDIPLGTREDGREVTLPAYGANLLVVGPSGSGTSALTVGFAERLEATGYQFCLVDPAGDYEGPAEAVSLGDSHHAPTVEEVMQVLKQVKTNAAPNLVGLSPNDRPAFFGRLFVRLQELQMRAARPHWVIVDEAHNVLPANWTTAPSRLPQRFQGVALISTSPKLIAPSALAAVNVVAVVGEATGKALAEFADATGMPMPRGAPDRLAQGEALAWFRGSGEPPFRFTVAPRRQHTAPASLGEQR